MKCHPMTIMHWSTKQFTTSMLQLPFWCYGHDKAMNDTSMVSDVKESGTAMSSKHWHKNGQSKWPCNRLCLMMPIGLLILVLTCARWMTQAGSHILKKLILACRLPVWNNLWLPTHTPPQHGTGHMHCKWLCTKLRTHIFSMSLIDSRNCSCDCTSLFRSLVKELAGDHCPKSLWESPHSLRWQIKIHWLLGASSMDHQGLDYSSIGPLLLGVWVATISHHRHINSRSFHCKYGGLLLQTNLIGVVNVDVVSGRGIDGCEVSHFPEQQCFQPVHSSRYWLGSCELLSV